MKRQPDCILILRSGHPLNNRAVELARTKLAVSHILESGDWDVWKDEINNYNVKFVFNFLSERVLRGSVLSGEVVNFHPAPPEYPGVGTAGYALFDGVVVYGATAHRMDERPDTGEILLVERFPISNNDTCETLSARAEKSCLDLLATILAHVGSHGALPDPCGDKWAREPFTRKELEKWLILDADDPEGFERKIIAARHSCHPGPYVIVNGHKFTLADD